MLLLINHTTRFEYDQPAYDSQNELRIHPWHGPGQNCRKFELSIDQPAAILTYDDFFGNLSHSVSVSSPHQSITIVSRSVVERTALAPFEYSEVPFSSFLSGDDSRMCAY